MTSAGDFSYDSPTVPAGALFIAGHGVSPVYPSAAAAERTLDPVYAENGRYPVAYGLSGRRYRVTREGSRVSIEPTIEPDAPDELRKVLLHYLKDTHRSVDDTLSLPELANQVWKLESEFWQLNDPYGDRFAKSVPWYGCVGIVIAAAALLYVFLRFV